MNIKLKTLREETTLNQMQLAYKSGVSLMTISAIENGVEPKVKTLFKITRVLSAELKRPFWDVFQELVEIQPEQVRLFQGS